VGAFLIDYLGGDGIEEVFCLDVDSINFIFNV